MGTIIELNPIYSRYTGKSSDIKALLSYEEEGWYQGPFRKEKFVSTKSLLFKNKTFYRGFTNKLIDNIEGTAVKAVDYGIKFEKDPKLEGITFRKIQKKAISKIIKHNFGVLQAPTGSGKTIIFAGIISLVKTPVIVVVPTKVLLHQISKNLSDYFPNLKIGKYGDGNSNIEDITVGLINSIYKNKEIIKKNWGMIIVDEVHNVSSFKGRYGQFLTKCIAPIRYGFTATIDKREKQALAMEGLVGPKIFEIKKKDMKKYQPKPKLILLLDKEGNKFKRMPGKYGDVYTKAIVENRYRNSLIINEAEKWISKGKIVFIMVEKIKHGKKLLKMANIAMPGIFKFLHGKTRSEIREQEKALVLDKKRKGIIVTRIWGEGADVETIGAVINAVGGESERAAIQRMGRGTRGEKRVILIDIIDAENHRWFMEHSMKRICYYSSEGWL